MAVNRRSYIPVTKNPNWLLFCTGGLLTTGGLGSCLRLAYAEKPEMATTAYLAGSAGLCLTNVFYYRPDQRRSVSNWILLLTGGIVSATGFSYCLRLAMKEHPESTMIAFTVGTIGCIIMNSVVHTVIRSEQNPEFRYSQKEVSLDEIFHIPKCKNPKLQYIEGVYQCLHCKAHFGKEKTEQINTENKSELTHRMEKREDFLRQMQKSLHEINMKHETKLTAEKTNVDGLFHEPSGFFLEKNKKLYIRKNIENCRDWATQTDSLLRIKGTQTQASEMQEETLVKKDFNVEKRLERMPQLQNGVTDVSNGVTDVSNGVTDVSNGVTDVPNGDQQPEKQ